MSLRMDAREIQQLEQLCVEDDAPWCQAGCPLHVDARGMLEAIARGDFRAAAGIYAKKVPFPEILSRICDQPCRLVCKRREAGDAINIGLLERSCAEFAGFAPQPARRGPPGAGRVAVIGGGLSGLSAAAELIKRRHNVTLFEESPHLGGRLRLFPTGVLPPDIVEQEISAVTAAGGGAATRAVTGAGAAAHRRADRTPMPGSAADAAISADATDAVARARGATSGAAAATLDIRHGVRLGRDISLAELLDAYDAVYLAIGAGGAGPAQPAEETDPSVVHALTGGIDPVTFATVEPGVFAGGSLRRASTVRGGDGTGAPAGAGAAVGAPTGGDIQAGGGVAGTGTPAARDLQAAGDSGPTRYSPVSSISDGRRAAVSIDRFLKGESLTAQRENEGPYDTRLYTSLEGVKPRKAVSPAEPGIGYDSGEAIAEAARCLQCRCLECVKACTYLEHFREYPGTCIRKVTKNITSLPGKSYRSHTPFINACSLCGLCGIVCPTDLDMAVVNSEARRIMWEKGYMPPAIHDFAIRDMEGSNAGLNAFTRAQPGYDSCSYLFFPGCRLAASAPENVERTYRHLTNILPGGVGLALGCCGAPAAWAGRQDLLQETLEIFTHSWREMGQPTAILACPTCTLMFKQGLPQTPVVSLWEILDKEGLPAEAPRGQGQTLALHDSCTARSATKIQDGVRSLAKKLGYEIEELPYSREMTKCCGYGGLMYLINPGLTGEVIQSRTEESCSDYLTYCVNCRDFFARKGKASYHMLDLIFAGYQADVPARPGPTLAQSVQNRRELANRLLTEVWEEPVPEQPEYMKLKLRIPAEVEAKMERDLILPDDVRQVIHQAELTGNKLLAPETGRMVAHYRPSIITYWVEYVAHGDEYEVLNAYSHRMQIVKEV